MTGQEGDIVAQFTERGASTLERIGGKMGSGSKIVGKLMYRSFDVWFLADVDTLVRYRTRMNFSEAKFDFPKTQNRAYRSGPEVQSYFLEMGLLGRR